MTTIYGRILDFRYEGNQWEPEAITFPEKPRFDSKKRYQLGDNFLGKTNFEGIEVGPILLFRTPFGGEEIYDNMEEISNDAMRNFTEELIKDGGVRSVSTSWLD